MGEYCRFVFGERLARYLKALLYPACGLASYTTNAIIKISFITSLLVSSENPRPTDSAGGLVVSNINFRFLKGHWD